MVAYDSYTLKRTKRKISLKQHKHPIYFYNYKSYFHSNLFRFKNFHKKRYEVSVDRNVADSIQHVIGFTLILHPESIKLIK